ncbi:MAG: phosphatidylinositol-specific phospholipase C domain-containing protein [Clostridia bacterium]|nr:phosphatidylinositol-specific phospholipase C domain-containing protein [Clostridia bacterium]
MSNKKKKSFPGRFLGALLTVVFVLLAVFGVLMYLIPATETVDKTPVSGSADWMKDVDDGLYLSEVVLPGTHDSGSKNAQLAFFSKCQALTVGEQLEAGFRYLDIRLAVDGQGMKLMHGFTDCTDGEWPWSGKLTLENVLSQCYDFLKAHPTETVVFAVKKEHGDETEAYFAKLFEDIILENEDAWFLSGWVPKVGEVRGKLVLVRRYGPALGQGGTMLGLPLIWDDQGGRDDVSLHISSHTIANGTLWVQDRYKYDTDEKWAAFLNGLREGRTDLDDGGNLSIHFLSTNGSPKFGHPYKYAKALNEKLMSSDAALRGWVITDFGSPRIAERIWRRNFAE